MERQVAKSKVTTKSKFQEIKRIVGGSEDVTSPSKPICLQINQCSHHGNCHSNTKMLEAPIILEKRTPKSTKNLLKPLMEFKVPATYSPRSTLMQDKTVKKQVEQFKPVEIPVRKAKDIGEFIVQPQTKTKQIEVRIQKDDKDECLKKLFKKINKLTEDLNESEKKRHKLELQLENLKGLENRQKEYEKKIRDLQLAKHKLELELSTLRELLQQEKYKPPQVVQKIVERPVEVIKQVPVQKIVQVQVEVPKLVPGPERIIEKFVEIPKYIEVQKKVPMEIVKEVVREVPKEVIKTVQVPQFVEKPVYIDKPVYVDRVVEKKVEVPIEVPIQVPVYVDRPAVYSQKGEGDRLNMHRLSQLEQELRNLSKENEGLRRSNSELIYNLQLLKRHNEAKNREVEQLIENTHEHTMLTKGPLGGYSFRQANLRSFELERRI